MAESITQPDMDQGRDTRDTTTLVETAENTKESFEIATGQLEAILASIIWTPRFIITFTLLLVLGLSAESLLTQSIASGLLALGWVLLGHTVLLCACWIAIITVARSAWIRIGGIFGCIWTIFAGISYAVSALPIDPKSANIVHLHAATATALFGCYICLSINKTLLHHWDHWFFRLASIVGACAVAVGYFLLPATIRSTSSLEGVTATVMLFLCLFVWWLRPSCWRNMPGATFLFGATPTLLLLLAIPGFADTTATFFFSQVALLALLLGALRILQGETL